MHTYRGGVRFPDDSSIPFHSFAIPSAQINTLIATNDSGRRHCLITIHTPTEFLALSFFFIYINPVPSADTPAPRISIQSTSYPNKPKQKKTSFESSPK
ncbi:hypothetical protein EYC80_005013 [Monilinia laxa]|uniref:Uncharacterized protein n=1 Tax=Monilinia laxa TaxID=61186 RepID=A0A5N6KIV9_MONLA|nr:hypothetical protein EYC80_005013 [Monilinia laxa]